MSPKLILFIGAFFIAFVFIAERRWVGKVSPALLLVLLWCLVTATQPVGVWLNIWGFPVTGSLDPTEGSIYDRIFYGTLTLIGIYILFRRRIDWAAVVKKNIWLLVFFVFMGVSIMWSDFPMVSFKRLIKAFGAMIMGLIVLTELDRKAAVASLLRWCAYIHVPFSIITIKYFRHIGVMWNNFSGEASWVGIATSKNTLGQVAAISALYFIWDWSKNHGNKMARIIAFVYLLMSLYLLKGSDKEVSMTSVSVFGLGLLVFWWLWLVKYNPLKVRHFFVTTCILVLCLLSLLIVHANVNFSEKSLIGTVIKFFGRDITLTGRTEIWTDVFRIASRSPLLGIGYGAFWIARIANIPWTEKLSWTLGQAHNGYVDTYLQLGWVGVCLLMLVILSAVFGIARSYVNDFELGRIRIILFLVILYVNITETTFLRGDHYLWFLFLLTALSVPYMESTDSLETGHLRSIDAIKVPSEGKTATNVSP